jgi:glycosyltransferase involved in cell wall biosynthesis
VAGFLFDAHQLGRRQTGNEVWARNVGERLAAHLTGDELTIATTDLGVGELASWGATHPPVIVNGSSARRLIVDLPRVLRRSTYDAVLMQYTLPVWPTRSVVMIHDVSAAEPGAGAWLPPLTRARYRASFWSSAKLATSLLTVSEFTRGRIIELYGVPPDRVRVAPNAVDPDLALRLSAHPKHGQDRPPHGGWTILAVGNVLPRKNLGIAAEAVAGLVRAGLDARLRIVGSVPDQGRDLAAAMQRILGDRVSFSGYVTLDQLVDEYRSADTLVMPSSYEGFGIPVLEAMTAGIPVVTSDSSALREVGGGAALLAPLGVLDSWADQLGAIASDAVLRDDLIARGSAQAALFDWENSAKVTAAALVDAAGQ